MIDPIETRDAITLALEAAALNPEVAEFKVGVFKLSHGFHGSTQIYTA